MNNPAPQPQPGVLSDPDTFTEYLTFTLVSSPPADAVETVARIVVDLNRADDVATDLTVTVGISHNGWRQLLPRAEMPQALAPFESMRSGDRAFPSTPGDLFFMIKSGRVDLNVQAAKQLRQSLSDIAELIEDIQGFKYLDDRDLIGFVDGTENPVDDQRAAAVLVGDEQPAMSGGSYLMVQRYVHRMELWESQTIKEQEMVIGRTKANDVELDDEAKPAWAHTSKSIVEVDGEEIDMYRQNRPFGNAMEHGTMFVGFAKSPDVLSTSLRQMIVPDEDGTYDHLLDFVEAKTGTNYFAPSQTFLTQLTR